MKRRQIALVVAIVVAGGVGGVIMKRKAQAVPQPTAAASAAATQRAMELAPGDLARADRAELATLLVISGGLKAVDSALVKAKVAAEVKQLTVREGDKVLAGQLVGRLDATEYQWKLRQAEDQAAAAQAQLDIARRTHDNNKAPG